MKLKFDDNFIFFNSLDDKSLKIVLGYFSVFAVILNVLFLCFKPCEFPINSASKYVNIAGVPRRSQPFIVHTKSPIFLLKNMEDSGVELKPSGETIRFWNDNYQYIRTDGVVKIVLNHPIAVLTILMMKVVSLVCSIIVLVFTFFSPNLKPLIFICIYDICYLVFRLNVFNIREEIEAGLYTLFWISLMLIDYNHFKFVFNNSKKYLVIFISITILIGIMFFLVMIKASFSSISIIIWIIEPLFVLYAINKISIKPDLLFVNFGWSCTVNCIIYFTAILRLNSKMAIFESLDVTILSSYLAFLDVYVTGEVMKKKNSKERKISLGLTESNTKLDHLLDVLVARENELKDAVSFE